MADGEGCKCNAHCEHECACDADWTTKEVYDLRADLAQRTAERDEARREVCELLAQISQTTSRPTQPLNIANWRAWDCFTTHTNTPDVPVQNGGA